MKAKSIICIFYFLCLFAIIIFLKFKSFEFNTRDDLKPFGSYERVERTKAKNLFIIKSKQKGLGEPCSNRKIWSNQKISDTTKIRALYLINNKIPIWNDTIYLEWNNSRIRVNSDRMMWNRIRPLKELVKIECIEYNGRFLEKIEEYLYEISNQRSWAFSAHDSSLEYYNGRYFVELHSGKYLNISKTLALKILKINFLKLLIL